MVARDRDIFSQKRSLFGALWLWCSPLNVSPDKGGLVLGVDNRVMRDLFDQFRSWLSPLVDQLNDELLIGGQGQDVEMDEICFRSKTLDNCVLWVRYFAMVRRGSSKVFLAQLPYRVSKDFSFGSIQCEVHIKPTLSYALQELASVLRRDDGSFRLGAGSVCHTDSARAYKQLGVEDGPLFDGSFCNAKELKGLKLAHTNVKHKPPKPEFTKPFDVPVWQGIDDDWEVETRIGGTQKLDGFFASFRRDVGRQPFNTTGPTPKQADALEQGLHHRVRAFQCKFWMSGSDMFRVVGSLRKKERDDPGRASWSTLAEYLKVAEQCEQPKKRLAPDAGVGLLADSDRELDAGESQCSLLFDDDE